MPKRNYLIGGAAILAVLAVIGFVLFRPDTLFTDNTVDEQLDADVASALDEAAAEPAATSTQDEAPQEGSDEPAPETSAQPPTSAAGPVVTASGDFFSIDHETTGRAAVIEEAGSSTLVLDDLATDNGPDLFVYLSTAEATEDADYDADFVDLGGLKGNQGTQTYEIPDDVDTSKYSSVVVWCRRFSVGFGAAPLA
ncbi:MAG: DM13 domain-containing protein [Microthrixaceae bacterium]|nr:DM13 domain-containing protein [Microthrixaceae bacterium]